MCISLPSDQKLRAVGQQKEGLLLLASYAGINRIRFKGYFSARAPLPLVGVYTQRAQNVTRIVQDIYRECF